MKLLYAVVFLLLFSISYSGPLDRLIEFALENNPRLKSFEKRSASFKYRADFSRALPNPQITFSLNNVETERLLPRKENPMSGFVLFLSQKYPLPAKRTRTSEIFLAKAQEVDFSRDKFQKDLINSLKNYYWEFSYSFEIERILLDIEKEINSLIEITEEKYRYGKALLSDLILLRVELLKVKERLAEAEKLRETVKSKIFALAGGKLTLEPTPLEPLDFLESFDPEKNVSVRLFKQKVETAKREVERAKVEHYPDLTLGAGYMARPDIPDLLTLRLGFTIPLWYSSRERKLVLEKTELYRSRLLELEDVKLSVEGDFRALESEYRINREILETIEKEIEEKRKEISALLIAYEYDRTDIREILRAYRILWSLEFDRAKVIKVLNQIVAKAEALQ